MSVKDRKIIPPEEGWKQKTWYLVEVSYRKGNPIHYNLFYSGFLNGLGTTPGGYNGLVPSNGPCYEGRPTQIHQVKYMRVVRTLLSEEEVENTPWEALL